MIARDVLNKTLSIMGITDNEGNPVISERIKKKSIELINLVFCDLNTIIGNDEFTPIKSLSDEIFLPEKILCEAFIYGLAMHISFAEGDPDSQAYFSVLYNKKRTSVNGKAIIKDNF